MSPKGNYARCRRTFFVEPTMGFNKNRYERVNKSLPSLLETRPNLGRKCVVNLFVRALD